ncbi:30S ribosomal protein S7 [Candidatus Trichorickettsia mobilis]|uniref:Small ribosomal subunit protein uS7 n=1 Tax=Candidatus Trichorickettsia mobilis TaxID=1346319 RepID=A0ABZ0UTN7_9RICK|nr:30S ribosomal protein S7 [Candidatus Trichorickettsia mobilis]WPY00447.1 30S ribosomal protein S7 [Candidatus Trichorickettsia mobilis]
MSRRHAAEKRVILPDMKYNSVLLARFINNVMQEGKKALAEKIVYGALNRIEKKHRADPFETFNNAMHNVKPYLEVTSVRVGGANYQVPSPVDERRGYALACRWIIAASVKRSEKAMIDKLSEELFDAANHRGGAMKKREDTHKMAEANKAFSHFSSRKTQR